ncbi:MAG: helix-turn-helix transcriptional regulator [Clostridia bacterium]|nr:helix-turn-helix transcriptional regulator [Clostridia bacterium]
MDYLDKLIKLREEKGLTQKDLTEIYGCNQSNISKIERKERKLNIEQLIALCRFYSVSADYVLGLSDFTDIRR